MGVPHVHELGLCSSIVEAIERHAAGRPVASVRVQVGRLHHVHPDAFEQSFTMAAMGTVAEDATAQLVLLPIAARCPACGHTWHCDELPLACPDCHAVGAELTGGDELMLESIEYRAATADAAAPTDPG
jgi:hydrogenase nickel incorporation protein HypA/HybF